MEESDFSNRLKGSMSGNTCDFNNIEMRALIKFFFLQGKAPKEIHVILTETLREHAPSYATIKNRVAQFKRGDFSTCDAPRPGRPKTVTTPEIINQIHEIILEDRRISAKSIAEQLGISRERVGSIIHEDLDMRKLSACLSWAEDLSAPRRLCEPVMSNEEKLLPDVTYGEDYTADVIHANIKQEPHVEDEYQQTETDSLMTPQEVQRVGFPCNEQHSDGIEKHNEVHGHLLEPEVIINVKQEPQHVGSEDSVQIAANLKDESSGNVHNNENVQNETTVKKKKKKSKLPLEKNYICTVCNKAFALPYLLRKHSTIHSGVKPYECTLCHKHFLQKAHLDRHQVVHTRERYHCNACDKSFSQLSTMHQHMRLHTGEQVHQCPDCHKFFPVKAKLDQHSIVHTGQKIYQCSLCKKLFKYKVALDRHIKMHNRDGHLCSVCNKVFATQSHLERHVRVHTGEKPFNCEVCGRAFSSKYNYQQHLVVHSGEKPFICNICNKAYTKRSKLKNHIHVHHTEKVYSCPFCQLTFPSQLSLERHVLFSHNLGDPAKFRNLSPEIDEVGSSSVVNCSTGTEGKPL